MNAISPPMINSTPPPPRGNSNKKKSSSRQSTSFVQGAIEAMERVRAEHGRCVFVFTAPSRKTGTTYVVNMIAEELTAQFDATIAVIPTEALKGCDPKKMPQGYVEQAPKLWAAVPDEALNHMPDFALESVWISPGANGFDFVLVDCPALEASPVALRWAAEVDGVVMVVQAGSTRIDQIESAQRLLQSSAGKLKGMILNRRTYPIPRFLYKIL